MNPYNSLADDYYVNMNLEHRDGALGQPRDDPALLRADAEKVSADAELLRPRKGRLRPRRGQGPRQLPLVLGRAAADLLGYVNPGTIDEALVQHRHALELAPYGLSVSTLDCEALDLLIGFDFSYRGNQNELIAEALGVCPAFEKLATMPGATFIGNEPSLTLALDPECRMQCRVNVETRTNAYQIRTQDFQEEQVSVYVTARQYGSLSPDTTYVAAIDTPRPPRPGSGRRLRRRQRAGAARAGDFAG